MVQLISFLLGNYSIFKKIDTKISQKVYKICDKCDILSYISLIVRNSEEER